MKYRLRWPAKILLGLLALVLGLLIAGFVMNESRPVGTPSSQADILAKQVAQRAGVDAWQKLEAISWDFGGRQQHLWDKKRHLASIQMGDAKVLMNLNDQTGRAYRGGQELQGEEKKALLEKGYSKWCNDSFWLNPLAKLFDEGVKRSLVTHKGQKGLLIEYGNGGVTPGDAYLWILGSNGLPRAWKMWVNIIPIGGLELSWEGWQTHEGAKLASLHKGLFTLELKDIKAGALSKVAPGPDPFAKLFENTKAPASQPAEQPASQPASAPATP